MVEELIADLKENRNKEIIDFSEENIDNRKKELQEAEETEDENMQKEMKTNT